MLRHRSTARPAPLGLGRRFRRPSSWAWLASLAALLVLGGVWAGWQATGKEPQAQAQAQAPAFAHSGFKTAWDRTDAQVASFAVNRSWVWGPVPGASLQEPFEGLPGNAHLVQYFDKGRMEINNPAGDPNDPFFVTNGLLTVELVSGQLRTGLNKVEGRSPAAINLASDADDPSAPTYQSFNGVSSYAGAPGDRRATDKTGQIVRTAIDRQGVTQPWPNDHLDYGVKIARFEGATGHNIPDIFWEYLNQQADIVQGGQAVKGPLFYPWFAVTGYPISEPYWSYVKVEGRYTDVLIQAYERRVLTFVPHLPTPFKVQMGNIGQHYYEWRYGKGSGQPNPQPPVPTPTAVAPPALPKLVINDIAYRASIIDLNGNYCTITNAGPSPVRLDGWWLDSPKWSFVDRFYFPSDIVLQPGASIKVHAGPGINTPTDIFMFRTSVMWEGQPYDLAVLYDNYGREVVRFFPAAEKGVPPTAPPVGTPAATPVGTPQKGDGTATPVPNPTSSGGSDPTPTIAVPTAQPTGPVPVPSSTATSTPTSTPTGTPPTATPTATRTP